MGTDVPVRLEGSTKTTAQGCPCECFGLEEGHKSLSDKGLVGLTPPV